MVLNVTSKTKFYFYVFLTLFDEGKISQCDWRNRRWRHQKFWRTFQVKSLAFEAQPLAFEVRRLTFEVRRLTFEVRRLTFEVRRLTFVKKRWGHPWSRPDPERSTLRRRPTTIKFQLPEIRKRLCCIRWYWK